MYYLHKNDIIRVLAYKRTAFRLYLIIMNDRATLLWMDLEMTGLDPKQDRILEVAVIATDWEFNEIAQYTAVTKVDENLVDERMVGEFWEKFPQVRQALVQQNDKGRDRMIVEDELLAFINQMAWWVY